MAYVFKISKPSYNVLTTTNPNELIYSSEYDTFKDYLEGTADLYIDNTAPNDSVTITHNLGYIPYFTATCIPDFGTYANKGMLMPFAADIGSAHLIAQVYATTTTLVCTFDAEGGSSGIYSGGVTINYKLYKNNTGL